MTSNQTEPQTNNNEDTKTSKKSKSSVLEAGAVESRGIGTSGTADAVDKEIQEFLDRPFSLLDEARSFFTVWTFLTRLPGPTWCDHHPGYLMRGNAVFPLVGTFIGLFCGVWFEATLAFLGDHIETTPKIAAFVSTAASFWLTGCFHEDGLADSGDGIGGGWSRKQILTIMSDTRLGTYGCAILILYVCAKLEMVAATGMQGLLLAHTYARWTAPFMTRTNDYVDDSDGPKTAYYSFMLKASSLVTWSRVLVATVYTLTVGTLCLDSLFKACILLVVMLVVSVAAGRYATFLLGGVMGDFLGATICVSEIIAYIVTLKFDRMVPFGSFSNLMSDFSPFWPSEEQWLAGFQLALLVGGTMLWSRNVGPPNVFVREEVFVPENDAVAEKKEI